MDQYNIIPDLTIGNARSALGYNMAATDLCVGKESPMLHMYAHIAGMYGADITVVYVDNGFMYQDGVAGFWDFRSIPENAIIAKYTCMWCGGREHIVLRGIIKPTHGIAGCVATPIDDSHGIGWCDKCESYCYGDCSSN